jgi:hypothetical protein
LINYLDRAYGCWQFDGAIEVEKKNKSKKVIGIVLFCIGIVGIIVSIWLIISDFQRMDTTGSDTISKRFAIGLPLLLFSSVSALGGIITWFIALWKDKNQNP